MSTGVLLCFHVWKKETFSAVRQAEQYVSIQLRTASNSPKRAMRQKAAPWPIPAVKVSKLFRKEDKYSFLKHRHLTEISSSTKGFVAAVDKFTGLCQKEVSDSKLFLCASIWFPAHALNSLYTTLMYPNYFPEPFLKCLEGSKCIIFFFRNPISFLNLRIKSVSMGRITTKARGPSLH